MGGDDWDGDRLRIGPWVPGLGGRDGAAPADVEPHPLSGNSTAGRPRPRAKGSGEHDSVPNPRDHAAGPAGDDAEPEAFQGKPETRPVAEVGAPGVHAARGRRPLGGRRLWVIGAIVAVVGVTLIPLALRSSTPRNDRQNGTTNAIAGTPTTVTATSEQATPTPEISASQAGSRPPSPSPDAAKYGPVGYEAEAASNILTGAASVSSYPGSSGGKVVANIGRWGPGAKRSGTLSFPDVTVPANDVFTLVLYLVGDADPAAQTIVVSVSGAAPVSVTVPPGSSCCVTRTVQVTLAKGANTIVLGNADGRAPSIDRMVVSRP